MQDAVGRPQGRTTLRSRVGDFESGWDGNREVILDGLKNVHDHLKAIVDGFSETDVKLATPSPTPGPAPRRPGAAMNAARRPGTHTNRNTDQGARR